MTFCGLLLTEISNNGPHAIHDMFILKGMNPVTAFCNSHVGLSVANFLIQLQQLRGD